jgi:hypothetical protein
MRAGAESPVEYHDQTSSEELKPAMNIRLKGRLFGCVFFIFFLGSIAFNWYLLINNGYFYPKVSGLCPIAAMFGLLLVAFPSMARVRPNRADRKSMILTLIAGVIGAAIGGINLYLMNSYHP